MSHKITLLSISLIKGGAENQLVKLAVDLKKRGNDVSIVAVLPDHDFQEIISEYNINYKLIPFANIFSLFKIVSYFRKTNPDLIIAFMFGANMIGRFVKICTKIPLITSVRNNEIDKKFYYLYRLTHKIDTLTTFNSSYSIEKFIAQKLTVKSKSHLMNNSILVPKEVDLENKMNYQEVFHLLSMAHFRPQKDYRTLIEAIRILKDNNRKVELSILGHLYEQQWPFELIKKYGLESFIKIVGFTKDTDMYLKKSHAVILSSLWEGTPNALLEAMANKLPVVSSNIPGCKELIEMSQGGLLFKVEQPEDLANKIMQLMDMTDLQRSEIAAKGYKYVLENYSSKIVYDKWNKVIELALEKK